MVDAEAASSDPGEGGTRPGKLSASQWPSEPQFLSSTRVDLSPTVYNRRYGHHAQSFSSWLRLPEAHVN